MKAAQEFEAGEVIVQISGRNQEFFRVMKRKDLVAISKQTDINTKHEKLWLLSKPFGIENTGHVNYVIVDNQDDPELTKESWIELVEELNGE